MYLGKPFIRREITGNKTGIKSEIGREKTSLKVYKSKSCPTRALNPLIALIVVYLTHLFPFLLYDPISENLLVKSSSRTLLLNMGNI